MDLLTDLGVRARNFLADGVPNDDFATFAFMAAVRSHAFFTGFSLPPGAPGTCDYGPAPWSC